MGHDDWRVRVELPDEEGLRGLLGRLSGGLGTDAARLADELEGRRLAVTHDENSVFVYADSPAAAEKALAIVEAELAEEGIEPLQAATEHWLADEDRWDDEPPGTTWEEDEIARGYAPWEVRIEAGSRREAEELEERLRGEGLTVVRSFNYVIVGAASEDEARGLAARLGGEVEAGGEVVWETIPGNPFSLFGGLGS